MEKFKTLLDIVGFTSLFLLITSLGICFYGRLYEIPKSHFLHYVFITLTFYGLVIGLIWAFASLIIWIYFSEKRENK